MQDNIKDKNGSESIRLQVYLSRSGVASRRSSEKIILDGRVKVNGKVVTELGTKVFPSDEILLDDEKLSIEEKMRYVSDEKNRPVASELLKEKYPERLYNVGRLDMFSTGLIIFTNDGEFAKILSHPSSELEKEYIVETSVTLPWDLAESFEKGIRIDGVFTDARKPTT